MMRETAVSRDLCRTCLGVLRLQARLTRLDRAAADVDQEAERLFAEARWFVLALGRVRPCAGHKGVTRLARLLAETLTHRSMIKEIASCSR